MPPSPSSDDHYSGPQAVSVGFTRYSQKPRSFRRAFSAPHTLQATMPLSAHHEIIDLTNDTPDVNLLKHANEGVQPELENPTKRIKTASDTSINLPDEETSIPKGKYVTLRKNLERVQKRCTEKHHQLEAVDNERRQAFMQIDNLGFEVARLEDICKQKDTDVINRDHSILAMRMEIDTLRHVNGQQQAELDSFKRDSQDSKTALLNAESNRKNMVKELAKKQKELVAIEQELHGVKNAQATAKEMFRNQAIELEVEKKLNESLHRVNDRQGARSENVASQLKTQKAELTTAKKSLKAAEKALNNQASDKSCLEKEYKELNQAIESERDGWSMTKTHLLQKIQDNRGLSQKYGYKVSDNTIVESWDTLKHKIGQFVDKYTYPAVIKDTKIDRGLRVLTSRTVDFLAHPHLYSLVWESSIWSWLSNLVFVADSLVWAGKPGSMLNEMLSSIRDQVPRTNEELLCELHAVRSSCSGFLSRLAKENQTQVIQQDSITLMVKKIDRVCGGSDFNHLGALSDLMSIVLDAQELDSMRRKLKADFHFQITASDDQGAQLRYNVPFRPTSMTKRHPFSGVRFGPGAPQVSTVDLIISPALVKRGNNDGSDYARKTYLTKMEVACDVFMYLASQQSGPSNVIKTEGVGSLVTDNGLGDVENVVSVGSRAESSSIKREDMGHDGATVMWGGLQHVPSVSVAAKDSALKKSSARVTRSSAKKAMDSVGAGDESPDPLMEGEPRLFRRQTTPETHPRRSRNQKARDGEDEEYKPENGGENFF